MVCRIYMVGRCHGLGGGLGVLSRSGLSIWEYGGGGGAINSVCFSVMMVYNEIWDR